MSYARIRLVATSCDYYKAGNFIIVLSIQPMNPVLNEALSQLLHCSYLRIDLEMPAGRPWQVGAGLTRLTAVRCPARWLVF